MNKSIFIRWLQQFEYYIQSQNRYVLLILDNVGSHFPKKNIFNYVSLRSVKIIYLPKNSTAKLQPLDGGIIANFKRHYELIVSNFIAIRIDSGTPFPYKISLYSSFIIALFVWHKLIKSSTIKNCFSHCKITHYDWENRLKDTNYIHNNIPFNIQYDYINDTVIK
jgi:hypothetical protein